jgi:transposase InsO family protein
MLEFFWSGTGKSAREAAEAKSADVEQPVRADEVEAQRATTEERSRPVGEDRAPGVAEEKTARPPEFMENADFEQGQVSGVFLDGRIVHDISVNDRISSTAMAEASAGGANEASDGNNVEADDESATDEAAAGAGAVVDEGLFGAPRLTGRRRRGRRLVKPAAVKPPALSPQQRLLLLDTWRRSGLPAGDFAAMVGLSKHTLYAWKKKFDQEGPAGLLDQPRGAPRGSKLPDLTKRTILMLKQANPEWGCQRISDMLVRGPALPASPSAVARVLHEAGYALEEVATRPHPDKVRHFERATANQLWQTDLFTFVLKRQNRRIYLVAFMDDHSRFIVSYGLHASQSSALVLEVLRAGMVSHGAPAEILTDNGSQYVTWRGKSAFTKELEKRGIKQVVAAPRRPQTLGKIERFWGTLWRECVESAVFIDLGDAQRRIGLFIDHYNFSRPHSGIDGSTPADRFFGAASEVKKTLQARVAANALELARHGVPKTPFYLTGQVGGQPFSVHAEGERVILTGAGQERREVELTAPPETTTATLPEPICPAGVVSSRVDEGQEEPPAPGTSPLDAGLEELRSALGGLSDAEGGDA